jgi:hypothetical protein
MQNNDNDLIVLGLMASSKFPYDTSLSWDTPNGSFLTFFYASVNRVNAMALDLDQAQRSRSVEHITPSFPYYRHLDTVFPTV